jgi:molybdopterin synthase sulfur carrier subunit
VDRPAFTLAPGSIRIMKVKVRGYLTLRDVIGGQPFRVVEAERLTIQGLIDQLCQELGDEFAQAIAAYAAPGTTRPYLAILVNGRHYSHLPDGLATELVDGDEVSIFPPAAGGA